MSEKLFILKGKIKLESSAIVGSGQTKETDMDVITDADGRPFIPGTSFAGVLRNYASPYFDSREIEQLWGGKSQQSLLCFSDLQPSENRWALSIREGIKINPANQLAERGYLYDFQVMEKGSEFLFRIEAKLSRGNSQVECLLKKVFSCFVFLMENRIRIGAKTNVGFGEISLVDHQYYELDLANSVHLVAWLTNDLNKVGECKLDNCSFSKNNAEKNLYIEGTFTIRSSFIIRSYSEDPLAPDATSLKSGGNFVISGTSLKGAMRGRAERILNTLGGNQIKAQQILDNLFGTGEKKGKFQVNEVELNNYNAEQQVRIRIDRFTGGTQAEALIEEMPVFSPRESAPEFIIKINIEDCHDYEVGLVLLLLKDLWTGDLPIGGEKAIGRGRLQGLQAIIRYPFDSDSDEEIVISDSFLKVKDREENKNKLKKLDGLVKSLKRFLDTENKEEK